MQRVSDLLALGNYSPMTRRSYLSELRYLFSYYPDIRPSELTPELLLDYMIYLSKTLVCSRVKCKMAGQSFSFFFKHLLNKPYKIPTVLFAAHKSKLPAVMSVEEVHAIITNMANPKHQTLIMLMYSTGMRLGEISQLKITDIDSKQMRIKIVEGKGKKDRFVSLSQNVLVKLREYFSLYKPEEYLFNGQTKGKRYSTRSIQQVIKKAYMQNGLGDKQYTVHTIRHSFATHLLDNGTDLKVIQHLMGHCNLSQTMQYLHLSTERMAKIVNPYDRLMEQMKDHKKKSDQ